MGAGASVPESGTVRRAATEFLEPPRDVLVLIAQRARLVNRVRRGRLVPVWVCKKIAARLRDNARRPESRAALCWATEEWVRAVLWEQWPGLAKVRGEPPPSGTSAALLRAARRRWRSRSRASNAAAQAARPAPASERLDPERSQKERRILRENEGAVGDQPTREVSSEERSRDGDALEVARESSDDEKASPVAPAPR